MIHIYTKTRHISKIHTFLDSLQLEHKMYTINDTPSLEPFDLGVSYCYPRLIAEPLLSMPKKGFINYHPAPLPEYKGGIEANYPFKNEAEKAIHNKEINWGVTVHYMNERYDAGVIIKMEKIFLHEPPTSPQELGAISHYFLFNLFKETILKIYEKSY